MESVESSGSEENLTIPPKDYDMEPQNEDASCTVEELLAILTAESGGIFMMPSNACDEVFPGIYVGEESIAKSRARLKEMGITHIINAAQGDSNCHVNTNGEMYKKVDIEYLGIEAADHMNFPLNEHFKQSADFIQTALERGGKVMVNCKVGASRSATLVVAYLMLNEKIKVRNALRHIRAAREICPNDGFLQQLCDLHLTLSKCGHYGKD